MLRAPAADDDLAGTIPPEPGGSDGIKQTLADLGSIDTIGTGAELGAELRSRLAAIEGKLDKLVFQVGSFQAPGDADRQRSQVGGIAGTVAVATLTVPGPVLVQTSTTSSPAVSLAPPSSPARSPMGVFRHEAPKVTGDPLLDMALPSQVDTDKAPDELRSSANGQPTHSSMCRQEVDSDEPCQDELPKAVSSFRNSSERRKSNDSQRFLRSETGMVTKVSWDIYATEPKFIRLLRSRGLWELISRLQVSMEEIQKTRRWKIVHSTQAQLIVSVIILLQGLLVGYGASDAMYRAVGGGEPSKIIDFGEIFFAFFFIAELLVRVWTERVCFLFGPEWKWNYFDTLLVGLSWIDIGLNGTESGKMAGAAVGRILRLSRFAVLMRISRVMRQLPSLRLILLAILNSFMSLLWCFLFIAFIMYVFAVLFVYGAAEFFKNGGAEEQEVVAGQLKLYWNGIYRSMVTLFMTISGGVDWRDVIEPLRSMSSVYEPLFLFYVFFMCFGVLNVVIGAFVATTNQISETDRESLVQFSIKELDGYTKRIKMFFKEADIDKSGTLSWEEFSHHLQDPKVKGFFQALQLDVSQAHILFDLLDTDGSDSVTVEEFIDGCVRLRGGARSIDLNMLVFMCQRTFTQLHEWMARNDQASKPWSS